MTREEATAQVQRFLADHGLKSPGLNAKGLGGASIDGAQVYFQFLEQQGVLKASALIHKFRSRPRPQVLESFRTEQKEGTDAGGGAVDYEAVAKAVFLSRSYSSPLPGPRFREEVDRLMEAAELWRRDVVPRVAERAFKHNLR